MALALKAPVRLQRFVRLCSKWLKQKLNTYLNLLKLSWRFAKIAKKNARKPTSTLNVRLAGKHVRLVLRSARQSPFRQFYF